MGRKIKISGLLLAAFLFLLAAGYIVNASTDGTLGPTSQGDLSMDLSIPNLIKISDIADLNFGNYSGTGTASQDDDVCIYTNQSAGQYQVTARGSGAAFAFTLTNGSHTIPYSVRWNEVSGTSGNIALTTNVASATQDNGNTTSQNCGGSNNANFQVTMTQSALLNVPADTYTGILTLIVNPL